MGPPIPSHSWIIDYRPPLNMRRSRCCSHIIQSLYVTFSFPSFRLKLHAWHVLRATSNAEMKSKASCTRGRVRACEDGLLLSSSGAREVGGGSQMWTERQRTSDSTGMTRVCVCIFERISPCNVQPPRLLFCPTHGPLRRRRP